MLYPCNYHKQVCTSEHFGTWAGVFISHTSAIPLWYNQTGIRCCLFIHLVLGEIFIIFQIYPCPFCWLQCFAQPGLYYKIVQHHLLVFVFKGANVHCLRLHLLLTCMHVHNPNQSRTSHHQSPNGLITRLFNSLLVLFSFKKISVASFSSQHFPTTVACPIP